MTSQLLFANAADIATNDYCVFGLATCFLRDAEKVQQVKIIEPIASAALEAILQGIPTAYEVAFAKTLGEFVLADKIVVPADFPESAQLCEGFTERALAATRTYKVRPEATKHIPLGTGKRDFNYSLEKKRILNSEHIVRPEDNVKQHSHTHKVL